MKDTSKKYRWHREAAMNRWSHGYTLVEEQAEPMYGEGIIESIVEILKEETDEIQ